MVGSLGVESVPVDHGFLRGKTEHTRTGVAILRQWRGTADFDDRRSEFEQRVGDFGMFVQTTGDTNGVGECVSEDLGPSELITPQSQDSWD